MPNPDGINVFLNGAYLDLKGAEPVFRDGGDAGIEAPDLLGAALAMLPLRATLEAMGARVDDQDGAITARLSAPLAGQPGFLLGGQLENGKKGVGRGPLL